jgi:hypothetical protein
VGPSNIHQETLNGKIDLPEDEPAMIRLLLQYLYEGEYEPCFPDIPKSLKELRDGSLIDTSLSHGEGMPYDYDFPHRCNIYNSYISCGREICPHHTCGTDCKVPGCRNFICKACKIPKSSAAQLLVHAKMYEYADKYDVTGLKELSSAKFEAACQVFWDEDFFVPAAQHALSTTMDEDRGLRDVVSATIAKHKELIAKPAVETLLTQFNGLSIDIFKQVAKKCSCGLEPKQLWWIGVERHIVMIGALDVGKTNACVYLDVFVSTRRLYRGTRTEGQR